MGTSEGVKKQWAKLSPEERKKRTENAVKVSVDRKSVQKYWDNASDDEKKRRMDLTRKSVKLTEEQRRENGKKGGLLRAKQLKETQSQFMKDYWANLSEEERAARKKPPKLSDTSRSKISATQKKINQDPEIQKRKSEAQKNAWAKLSVEERRKRTDPGNRARSNAVRNLKHTISSIEIKIHSVLDELKIEYETQKWMGGKISERWCLDIYIPHDKLIINCDGEYWHSFPDRIKNDRLLDEWCMKHKYNIIHLKESDINKDAKAALMSAVQELKKRIKDVRK